MVSCSSPVEDGGRWHEAHAQAEELQSSAPTDLSTSPSDSSPSSACRALVYDAETGSLRRYSQLSGRAAAVTSSRLSPRSPRSPPSRFELVPPPESNEQYKLGEGGGGGGAAVESPRTPPSVHGKLHCGAYTESGIHEGETSPTCVIQNSAARSRSSSPARVSSSAASKASADAPGRDEVRKLGAAPAPEVEQESTDSPRSEPQQIIDHVRERTKNLELSFGTTASEIPGAPPRQLTQFNGDPVTITKEFNNCHDHTTPFKSMAEAKKSKHHGAGRVPALTTTSSGHTASIVHCKSRSPGGGVFSFNAAYVPLRTDHKDTMIDSETLFSETRGDVPASQGRGTGINAATHLQQQQPRRTYNLAPLLMLKPAPSKWDDAEKWLPGSECQSATTRARTTSRSGPLLAQMVAAQAGMSIPWRGAINAPVGHVHHHLSSSAGVAPEQRVLTEPTEVRRDSAVGLEAREEHVKDFQAPSPGISPSAPQTLVGSAADNREKPRLRDRYAVENSRELGPSKEGSREFVAQNDDDDDDDDDDDGSASPSRWNGSFLKLGVRMEKPQVVVEFSPSSDFDSRAALADLDFASKSSTDANARIPGVSETRDMGTAMTPAASVDPSRTSTPLRAITTTRTECRLSVQRSGDGSDHDAETSKSAGAMMSEREIQERKTRQEIVTLGTRLGKASIAAAWAARQKENPEGPEKGKSESQSGAGERNDAGSSVVQSDMENNNFTGRTQLDVFASRAEAWQDAEKAKYTSRFEQDQAKIRAWEEHEKARAEAEMRRAEVKAERLKSQAHERLAHRLAGARRRAEELAAAAEARRADAAAKAARKAEILKTSGRVTTNLLFLSHLCT